MKSDLKQQLDNIKTEIQALWEAIGGLRYRVDDLEDKNAKK